MKQLSFFIVLILVVNQIHHIQNTHFKNFQDSTPLKAVDIASEVVVQNTIKQLTKNVLNKSDVDKGPNSFKILTSDQSAESDPTQVGDEYYPGPSASVTVSESFKNPSKRISRPSYRYYKKLRNIPYYGQPELFRGLANNNPNGAISVPVVFMDLDDFKATQDQLQALQTRLSNSQIYVPQVNLEFSNNFNKTVYDKDNAPYYNTLSAHIKNSQDYLQSAIDKVETLLNVDINPNPLNYTLTETDPAGFENSQNTINEKDNNIIGNNYRYPVNFTADNSGQIALSTQTASDSSTNSTFSITSNATNSSSALNGTNLSNWGASNSNSGSLATASATSSELTNSNATNRIQKSEEKSAHLNKIKYLIKKERSLPYDKIPKGEKEEKTKITLDESNMNQNEANQNRKYSARRYVIRRDSNIAN